jgi:NADPH2:quinone reductase
MVNNGNASGHPPPLDLLLLAKKGSVSVCRPGLTSYIGDVPMMRAAAGELFDLVARGVLKVEISRTYALQDAAAAHRALEAGQATGSIVLLP